jgi:hypothetical protein
MKGGSALWDVPAGGSAFCDVDAGRIGIRECSCRKDRHHDMFLQGGSALWDVHAGKICVIHVI